MNNLELILETQKDLMESLIETLRRLHWIERYVRRVVHDDDGCEIEAWVGRPCETATVGSVYRADTFAECIDIAISARKYWASSSLVEIANGVI